LELVHEDVKRGRAVGHPDGLTVPGPDPPGAGQQRRRFLADRDQPGQRGPKPSSCARAAAASAFGTLWEPCNRSATGAGPSGVSSVKLGRPSSSSRISAARTGAAESGSTLKVTTRAAV